MTVEFPPIGLNEIERARDFIKMTSIVRTPVRKCPPQFSLAGTEIFLKCENEQITGSFKIRGAMNKLRSLTPAERKRGVICSSAGNHAQGVAYAAKESGVAAHIVMPVTTPIVKISATKSHGAEVILKGDFYDEAFQHASAIAKEMGYLFISPYQDAQIIAGQGTLGLEILEDLGDVDSIVVPIGGGGLISGIATAAKAKKPSIRIIGVVSNQAPA
ncbi:MAG: pyridoxal-phosphate dependent enzyme, partial [Bdellovibrionota bacterium]